MIEGSVFVVATAALLLNIPLGVWRERCRRLSLQWFLAIHLAVPIVITLRHLYGLPLGVAPLMLAFAIAGQVLGSRLGRRLRTEVVRT